MRAAIREQIRLVAPLGAGSVLYKVNDFGKVVVANQMGPVPLALYTTAAYQVPLVNIVQGALADVIFPDMVKRSQHDPRARPAAVEARAGADLRGDLSRRGCCSRISRSR